MQVERVDFIRVPAKDMARAREFYEGILGLEPSSNSPGDTWVEYLAGNVTLALMTPETSGLEFAGLPLATIALRVPDVAAAKEELERVGVETSQIWDSGVCKMIDVKDPSGNGVLLHRRYAPYPDGTSPDDQS